MWPSNWPLSFNMDFSLVAFILTIRRFIGLLFTPYKTMRTISVEGKRSELTWIYFFSILYFLLSGNVRAELWGIGTMIGLILFSVSFFSVLPTTSTIQKKWETICITWTYTLFPTLLWFYTTLIFYIVLPPPRSVSTLGMVFSIFYIAFSLSLLAWKLILVYLSIRFSLRAHVYRVLFYILIYLTVSIPVWITLYRLGMSRIPFV